MRPSQETDLSRLSDMFNKETLSSPCIEFLSFRFWHFIPELMDTILKSYKREEG